MHHGEASPTAVAVAATAFGGVGHRLAVKEDSFAAASGRVPLFVDFAKATRNFIYSSFHNIFLFPSIIYFCMVSAFFTSFSCQE